MLGWHRWRGTWRDRVSAYIALTNFQKHKLTAAGLPTQKIHVKPNFIFPPPLEPNPRENFALFVGRLAEEKGVSDLIAAYRYGQIHLPLKIVGDGPLRQALIEQTHTAGLEETISFLGRQERSTVLQLMQQAQFLIFPSIWYEGFPLTIVEAFACQLPVIVPAIGSMAEIVQDHETGLQFTANNPQDLSEKIQWAIQHATDMQDMGEQARQTYETCYTPEINYDRLMSIYQTALAA
jgi:glycosyltransferase involved in cell wall biosynthesis